MNRPSSEYGAKHTRSLNHSPKVSSSEWEACSKSRKQDSRQGVVFLGVPWSWEIQGRPFGAGFVGQQFRASFIAEPSLTPPLTDSVFMSATNVVIPCGEPTGANGRTDGRTTGGRGAGGSVCCNICNDVGAVYFLDKVILTASSRACAGRRRRLECFPNARASPCTLHGNGHQ